MELKNYDELIPQIARMMLDHAKAHTGYQEDIYLYVDADGNGTLKLFQNPGGNSWIDDDHYNVVSLRERFTDWTDTFQEISSVADALGWTVETLQERTAAWVNENGWHTQAKFVCYSDVWEFIEDHEPLLDKIRGAEEQWFEDDFSKYVEFATDILDAFLNEQEMD